MIFGPICITLPIIIAVLRLTKLCFLCNMKLNCEALVHLQLCIHYYCLCNDFININAVYNYASRSTNFYCIMFKLFLSAIV